MENSTNPDSEPTPIGDILADIDAVIGTTFDEATARPTEVSRLEAEVDELSTKRESLIEANMEGHAAYEMSETNEALLSAQADLHEAKQRHPSNPK